MRPPVGTGGADDAEHAPVEVALELIGRQSGRRAEGLRGGGAGAREGLCLERREGLTHGRMLPRPLHSWEGDDARRQGRMLGLVPGAMRTRHTRTRDESTVTSRRACDWNATSKPPPWRAVMLGLVSARTLRPQIRAPRAPTVTRRPAGDHEGDLEASVERRGDARARTWPGASRPRTWSPTSRPSRACRLRRLRPRPRSRRRTTR